MSSRRALTSNYPISRYKRAPYLAAKERRISRQKSGMLGRKHSACLVERALCLTTRALCYQKNSPLSVQKSPDIYIYIYIYIYILGTHFKLYLYYFQGGRALTLNNPVSRYISTDQICHCVAYAFFGYRCHICRRPLTSDYAIITLQHTATLCNTPHHVAAEEGAQLKKRALTGMGWLRFVGSFKL